MNKLFEYGSADLIPYYNCSGKTDEQWYATGVQRLLFGWGSLVFGIVAEILYIPTIYLIFKTKLVRHSCYKIIIFLGFTDMIVNSVASILSGFLFIKGAVYCNYPTLIYSAGSVANAGWFCACGFTLILVINRVADFLYQPMSKFLFDGFRVFFSIFIVLTYWLITWLFTPVLLFNSKIMAWVNNPLVIENPPQYILDIYRSDIELVNNWTFSFATCFLYGLYCILVNKKMGHGGHKSKTSKQVFFQSAIICFFNTVAALTYNAIILLSPPPFVVVFGEMCWSAVHGCPSIIYLTLNRTLRREFLKLIGLKTKITSCALYDIHITFFMQPVTLFPLFAGYSNGFLSKYFQVSSHNLMTGLAFFLSFQMNTLNICSVRKHQAIARISQKYLLTRKWLIVVFIWFYSHCALTTISISLSSIDKEKQFQLIHREFPQFEYQFRQLREFDIYEWNWGIITFFFCAIVLSSSAFVTVFMLTMHMCKTLADSVTKISKLTMEKQKSALKSLVAQFLTVPIAILPVMVIIFFLAIEFSGSQILSWISIMILSTHSCFNSSVVIFTLPGLRNSLVFCKKNRSQTQTTSVTTKKMSFGTRVADRQSSIIDVNR